MSAPRTPPIIRRLSLPATSPAEQAGDAVIRTLQAAGHLALRVGGGVRDRLLGRAAQDADVATTARPEQVQALFPRTYAVGAAFGVVVVHGENGSDVEVATFREETGYADGRHPDQIRYAGAAEDARRRDFTVNALFYDPVREELIDHTSGLADLARGVLRTVGEPAERFAEDSLRLLRAVRFAAELRFELDPATAAAIPPLAATLRRVSAERIFAELSRLLLGRDPARAFALLKTTGLLAVCLPEIDALAGVAQPPEFHPEGDVWTHTLLLLRALRAPSPTLAWAALLHDVAKPPTFSIDETGRIRFFTHAERGAEMAAAILERLKAPRQLIADVAACIGQHMRFGDVDGMRPAKIRRLLARPTFPDELELHRLDSLACHARLGNWLLLLDFARDLAATPPIPPPLLRGGDLLALGLPPGPRIGELLQAVQERQLDGDLRTPQEALAWVRERLAAAPAGAPADSATPRPPPLLIFDLDGTLADSRADLATAVNLTRADLGLPPLPLERVVTATGDGVRNLLLRTLPECPERIEEALRLNRGHYLAHLLDQTRLYPGVAQALKSLRRRGCKLAVATNKPREFTDRILAGLGVAELFAAVVGGGDLPQLKPDPAPLRHLLAATGADPARSWMVGDHHADLAAGRRAGLRRCFCQYGFGDPGGEGWEFRADTPADLARLPEPPPQ